MSRLLDAIPEQLKQLKPYQPGKPVEELERELGVTGALKLASNENPLGPPAAAVQAMSEALGSVNYYPDSGAFKLRNALAAQRGVAPEELMFGCGSNELIHLIMHAFCRPGYDEVLAHQYAFISYKLGAIAQGLSFVEAPVREDLTCDVDAMISRITDRTRVVFLANPNNPTGRYVPVGDFERLLAAIPDRALFVVDEAYHEYAVRAVDDYPCSFEYRQNRPNLITLRTFSKIYGLAGLRVGYGTATPEVVHVINRIRRPFNVNNLAQVAATAALAEDAHVDQSAKITRQCLGMLAGLCEEFGLTAYPSATNFLLVDVGRPAAEAERALQLQGVIARPMAAWGLPTCLRLSVAMPEMESRIGDAFRAVFS